jgi:hypothetical protein
MPPLLGLEMIHSYNLERVVHLTGSNGWLALACCMTRTPGVFICHTEAHAKALRRHVIQQLFRMKQSADDGVYDPSLITLLDSIPKDVDSTPIKEKKSTAGNVTPPKVTPASAKAAGGKPAKGTPASVKSKGQKKKKEKKGKKSKKVKKDAEDGSEDTESDDGEWPSDPSESDDGNE